MGGLLSGGLLISSPSVSPLKPSSHGFSQATAPPFMHTYRLAPPTHTHIDTSQRTSKHAKGSSVRWIRRGQHQHKTHLDCTAHFFISDTWVSSIFRIVSEFPQAPSQDRCKPSPGWEAFLRTDLPDPTPCTHGHTKAVLYHRSSDSWISVL